MQTGYENNLQELLEKKYQQEGETKEYICAKKMLDMPDLFFKINRDTALGLLAYLGIPTENLNNEYLKLISYDNYQKNTKKKIYQIIDLEDDSVRTS